jgi:hypothetical protein
VESAAEPLDEAGSDRDRVGDYVRRALPRALEHGGCDWPCAVAWDEVTVRAYLSPGELVLSTFHRRAHWWDPVSRKKGDEIVDDLGRVLLGMWRDHYHDADETGRCRRQLWMMRGGGLTNEPQSTGRAVTVVLEPGVRLGEVTGQGGYLVYRHGVHHGETYEDAVSLGWMQVE